MKTKKINVSLVAILLVTLLIAACEQQKPTREQLDDAIKSNVDSCYSKNDSLFYRMAGYEIVLSKDAVTWYLVSSPNASASSTSSDLVNKVRKAMSKKDAICVDEKLSSAVEKQQVSNEKAQQTFVDRFKALVNKTVMDSVVIWIDPWETKYEYCSPETRFIVEVIKDVPFESTESIVIYSKDIMGEKQDFKSEIWTDKSKKEAMHLLESKTQKKTTYKKEFLYKKI
jgi:hypothetical protein